jgi:hypothetical protein
MVARGKHMAVEIGVATMMVKMSLNLFLQHGERKIHLIPKTLITMVVMLYFWKNTVTQGR